MRHLSEQLYSCVTMCPLSCRLFRKKESCNSVYPAPRKPIFRFSESTVPIGFKLGTSTLFCLIINFPLRFLQKIKFS